MSNFLGAPMRAHAKNIVALFLISGSTAGGCYNHPPRPRFHEKPLPANDFYASVAERGSDEKCLIPAFAPCREIVIMSRPKFILHTRLVLPSSPKPSELIYKDSLERISDGT